MPKPATRIPARCGYTQRTIDRDTEQAIMLSLLEIPSFRRKAGLPPRHGGDTLATLAKLLGVSREAVRLIELRAMHKLRAAAWADPELRHAMAHIFTK